MVISRNVIASLYIIEESQLHVETDQNSQSRVVVVVDENQMLIFIRKNVVAAEFFFFVVRRMFKCPKQLKITRNNGLQKANESKMLYTPIRANQTLSIGYTMRRAS